MNNITNVDALSVRIRTLLEEERYEEAIGLCSDYAYTADDDESELAARLLLAHCLAASGQADKAVEEHSCALDNAPDMLSAELLGIAEEALNAHMPLDYCAGLFCRSAEQFENEGEAHLSASAFNKAGICIFRLGDAPEMEERYFRRALSVIEGAEPDNGESKQDILRALIQSNLAECLMRKGESDEAISLYSEASSVFASHLDEEGDMCLIHYAICQRCLSDLYRTKQENIRAHACLTQSINELDRRRDKLSDQLRLHLAVCFNARGTLRFQMGNYEGEVDDCTMSLQIREGLEDEPSSLATVYSNRAEAYAMLEQYDKAKSDFMRAIELFDREPDNGQAAASAATRYYSIGLLCDEQGNPADACDAYRSASERIAALRISGLPTLEYSGEQLIDLEAICRGRLSAALARLEERDYFEALTENREAVRLLEKLPFNANRLARLAVLHLHAAELLELFSELEAAEKEYEQAAIYRTESLRLIASDKNRHQSEEAPEEEFEDEGNIWEQLSGDTPQG